MQVQEDEVLWCEKYRPQTIKDCILPARLKGYFQSIVDKGQITNMLLTGNAGVGKCLDPLEEIELMVSDEIYEKLMRL